MSKWTIRDFSKLWKTKIERLRGDQYLKIYGQVGSQFFEVLEFAKFDEKIDGDKSLIKVSLTDFTEAPASYARRVLLGSAGRVVTWRGDPLYVLEQGRDALSFIASREGISVRFLLQACRQGELGRQIAQKIKKRERSERKSLEIAIAAREERIADLNSEIAALTLERNHLARELAARGAE